MFSERIFFIIERISDIVKLDDERQQILASWKNLSEDDRKAFLEFYSDDEINKFLELFSNDKIWEIQKLYSADDIKEFLKFCSHEEVEKIMETLSNEYMRSIHLNGKILENLKSFPFSTVGEMLKFGFSDKIDGGALEIQTLLPEVGVEKLTRLDGDARGQFELFLSWANRTGRQQELSRLLHQIMETLKSYITINFETPQLDYDELLLSVRKMDNINIIRPDSWLPHPELESHRTWESIENSYICRIKEILQSNYTDDELKKFRKLYSYAAIQELLKMYKELSDDDKEEFQDKYNDIWRKRILHNLKLHERCFQNHSATSFFGLFRFLKAQEEEREVVLMDNVKMGIGELKKELLRIYDYLRIVEAKYDDTQVLSEHEQNFYLILSCLADSSDDILNRVPGNDDFAGDIYHLVERIQNSYNSLNSPPIYNFNTGGNTNLTGGIQKNRTNIFLNPSRSSVMKNDLRPKSYGNVPNPDLVGFKSEIQILLNHLIQSHEETHVLGIVGPGGSGKTTLAKHIYHHPEINARFTRKVWVCISQSWNKVSILNSIWRQVDGDLRAQEMDEVQVVELLSQKLNLESYLVILDDIWSIDACCDIFPVLLSCSGSKVVITTRHKFLPQQIDSSVLIVEPKPLNDEESNELFKKRAFGPNESIPQDLLPLGMEMVEKCKGLPLAIVALAGILGGDKKRSSWERISQSLTEKILNMSNVSTQGVVKKILALSYHELPLFLKPCVLYLRVFPEDYEIEAQKLIGMWIAESFMDEEYVAEEYLAEIAQRCIIEVVKTNYKEQVESFRIHDLIRQMFIDMNQKEGLLKDSLRLVPSRTLYGVEQKGNTFQNSEMVSMENLTRILGLEADSYARSIIFLNRIDVSESLLHQLFVKFRLIRVLILNVIPEIQMPEEVGNMIHLRYLELKGRVKLYRSIDNLENLWTLDIREVADSTLQLHLSQQKELKHLYLPQVFNKLMVMENLKLERLKKLKTLWNARGGEWMLQLSDVLEKLCILEVNSKEQLEAVLKTPSIKSNKLHTLELGWWIGGVELCDMSILSKCESLEKLKLCGPIGVSTPIMFPSYLIELALIRTRIKEREVMNIISKLCPHLRILILEWNAYAGTELVCNAHSFPQLEELTLDRLHDLDLWIVEESAMPNLHQLKIWGCRKMDLNPEGWTLLLKIPKNRRILDEHLRGTLELIENVDGQSESSVQQQHCHSYVIVRIIILVISLSLLYILLA